MLSFVVIDSLGPEYAHCELELCSKSSETPLMERETTMVDIPIDMICQQESDVCEGDVLVVEHSSGVIETVYGKDEEEKSRRIEAYRQIMAE